MVAVGLEQLEFLERFQLATKRLAGCRGSLGGGQGVQYIQILDVEEVCVSFFVTGCC